MRPTSRPINTSRGPIVDQAALFKALASMHIAGAAVDVYDAEPLENPHPMRELPNVLATSHIAYVTQELYRTLYGDTVQNIIHWLDKGSAQS